MIKSWGRRSAFNVQKVLWLLDELALEYDHTELGGDFGGLDDPDFRAMNPHGKVPVINDGGVIVWESHAILRYLAAKYGKGSVWSDDPAVQSLSGPMDGLVVVTLAARFYGDLLGFLPHPTIQT